MSSVIHDSIVNTTSNSLVTWSVDFLLTLAQMCVGTCSNGVTTGSCSRLPNTWYIRVSGGKRHHISAWSWFCCIAVEWLSCSAPCSMRVSLVCEHVAINTKTESMNIMIGPPYGQEWYHAGLLQRSSIQPRKAWGKCYACTGLTLLLFSWGWRCYRSPDPLQRRGREGLKNTCIERNFRSKNLIGLLYHYWHGALGTKYISSTLSHFWPPNPWWLPASRAGRRILPAQWWSPQDDRRCAQTLEVKEIN